MNRKHKWSAFLAIAMICGSITGCAGTENNSRETVQSSSSIKEESQKSDDKSVSYTHLIKKKSRTNFIVCFTLLNFL